MGKTYDKYILSVLTKAGTAGITISNLVRHVYNMDRTLFTSPQLDEVDRSVRRFIRRNTGTPQSLVERMERRGFYRLNVSRQVSASQLMLKFEAHTANNTADNEQTDEPSRHEDRSLNLF